MDIKQTNGNGLELPKTVGIIYSDARREYFPTEAQYVTEKEALREAQVIASYLEKMNVQTRLYPGNEQLTELLRADMPDMVLNLVGSVRGLEYLAATIPGILEMLNIPYTGAGILGESLAYNKFLVKKLLEQNGVPVPRYQLFITPTDILDPSLRFPLISKLNEIHGGVEITKESVSENEKHLRERLKYLITTYKGSVVVEEFIAGRELTAILLEGMNTKVYLAEKIFHRHDDKYMFVTFEDQWTHGVDSFVYQKYDDPLLREYVRKAFDITRMDDYGKYDIRMHPSGRSYFIDSNRHPAFGPKELDIALASILDLYGVSFLDILKRLLLNIMREAAGKEKLRFSPDIPGEGQV